METTKQSGREVAVALASGAALEMFWSAVGVACALLAMLGTHPMTMSAVAAVATSLALLAHSGELAARWPSRDDMPSREAVGFNLLTALGALLLASLAIAGIAETWLAPIALLLLAGLLVLDAPLERELAARRGRAVGAYMALAGIGAILVLTAAFSAQVGGRLVPVAALLIASAQLVGAAAVLLRFARS